MAFAGERQLCHLDFAVYLYNLYADRNGCESCLDDSDLRLELEVCAIECPSSPSQGNCTGTSYFQPFELLATHLGTDSAGVKSETLIRQRTVYNDLDKILKNLRTLQDKYNQKYVPCYKTEEAPCPPPTCITPWQVAKKTPCKPCADHGGY